MAFTHGDSKNSLVQDQIRECPATGRKMVSFVPLPSRLLTSKEP